MAYDSKVNADLHNRLMHALQSEGKIKEISLQFAAIPTTIEKIDFATELLTTYDFLPKFIEDSKNNANSVELRKEGNNHFRQKEDEEALKLYTRGIAVAEHSSEELGLAYANRSAVLFKLKLFEDCLEDIQRALLNNYPEHLKPKLFERQKNAESLKAKQVKHPHHQTIPKIPENCKNATIECAADCVEIKNDPIVGRHIIATRDIEIGEIIAVEEAAFSVLTENKWCHCHHCLTLCYCLIPCESCTEALFCSVFCREQARKYHDFECPILATVHSLDFNSCRSLPLRIAILMKDEYNNLFEDAEKIENIYKSGRYKEIHNLVTNEKSRATANFFERIVAASLFYYLVKNHTNFFDGIGNDSDNIFKRLVLHHLQTMACNFHGIDDLEWNSASEVYETVTIGAGAFSFLSLFNHSCAANLERISYGRSIVLATTETILKGEQLFENYGFHYGMHTKTERQATLKKQYFFDCQCRACQNDWGTYDNLPRLKADMSILMLNYNKMANADLKTAKEIEPDVKRAVEELQDKIPCKDYCEIQELLKQCHCVFGNIRRVLN